jgi:hypothetical protein
MSQLAGNRLLYRKSPAVVAENLSSSYANTVSPLPLRAFVSKETTSVQRVLAPSKLLGGLVDLVGIEPTTSSMPFLTPHSDAATPTIPEQHRGAVIMRL